MFVFILLASIRGSGLEKKSTIEENTQDVQNEIVDPDSAINPSSSLEKICSTTDDKEKDPDYYTESTNNNLTNNVPANNTFILNEQERINNSLGDGNVRISKPIIDKLLERYKNVNRPHYESMKIQYTALKKGDELIRKRKRHLCIFCFQDHQQLKRHLERFHRTELLVQDMLAKTVSMPNSREPMKELIYLGDYVFNIDASKNNGTLRVVRETKIERSPDDFVACERCYGLFFNKDFVNHYRECLNHENNGSRGFKKKGRQLFTMCSSNAGERMKNEILPNMRHDKVFRAFRYDELIIEYGNDVCSRYRDQQNNAYVMTQLRRLGSLKLLLNLDKLSKMFLKCNTKMVIKAIEKMSQITEDGKLLKCPTVAQNMATLIKAVATSHMVNCYELGFNNLGKKIKTWSKVFEQRYKNGLSGLAAKSQAKRGFERKTELPPDDDLRKLYQYLRRQRIDNHDKLYKDEKNGIHEFDFIAYKALMAATLTSLQISNRRRPGDVERITVDNYRCIERLHEKPEAQELSENIKDFAKEYGIMTVRGKLGNAVKVLVSVELQLCIDMILKHRAKLDISPKNQYIFALPRTPNYQIRHLSAYTLLCRFAGQCGAAKPETLRATRLRKHFATDCLKLELNDAELTDLARYMGHHVNIHKTNYRQHMAARDIPIFTRFIEISTACQEDALKPTKSTQAQNKKLQSANGMSSSDSCNENLQQEVNINPDDSVLNVTVEGKLSTFVFVHLTNVKNSTNSSWLLFFFQKTANQEKGQLRMFLI